MKYSLYFPVLLLSLLLIGGCGGSASDNANADGSGAGDTTDSGSGDNGGDSGSGTTPPVETAGLPPGIPSPGFGIDENIEDYYTRPTDWSDETPGWYYVNQYHPEASNAHAYGTPNAPRATMPSPIPAGSVVVVGGEYNHAPTGYDVIQAEGSADSPVFIVSDDNDPAVVTRKWVVKSTYTIIDGLEFTDLGKVTFNYPSHHVALRNSELHHIPGKIGGGGRSDSERVHHIVIYNNRIHSEDGWDQNPEVDLDHHGIKFGQYTEDVWILNNVGYNNGGNFIQIGDWGAGDTEALNYSRRFYIGYNNLYANRQYPIGIKQATDIVISANELHDNKPIQQEQSGVGFQYGPERVWIIYNHIYNSNSGITAGSNSGGQGVDQYIIGNLIHDIATADPAGYSRNTGWAPAAIMLAGGRNRYIVDNTIWNADGGIHSPGGSGSLTIHGNVVGEIRLGRHVFIETGDAVADSQITGNLFYQSGDLPEVRLGSSSYTDMAALDADRDRASDNMNADPQLADPDSGDYRPLAGSPAIDSGSEHPVYQTFQDLYGLDIRRDQAGNSRPQGAGWDRGAFEHVD